MHMQRHTHSIFPMQTQTTSHIQNQQINLISTLGKLITQSRAWMAYEIFAAIMLRGVLGRLPTNCSAGSTAAFSPSYRPPAKAFCPLSPSVKPHESLCPAGTSLAPRKPQRFGHHQQKRSPSKKTKSDQNLALC